MGLRGAPPQLSGRRQAWRAFWTSAPPPNCRRGAGRPWIGLV